MFLFLWMLLAETGEGLATPMAATLEEAALVLSSYFPRVDGVIVSLEGGRVTIDIGKERGIIEGLVLTAYREESEFFHPLTGRPLGRFEKKLGTVKIDQAGDSVSTGSVSSSLADPVRVGDRVRLTSGRLPLRVIARSGMDPLLFHALLSALKETGRFYLITGEEEGEADYLLFCSLEGEELDLTLTTADRRAQLAVMEVFLILTKQGAELIKGRR